MSYHAGCWLFTRNTSSTKRSNSLLSNFVTFELAKLIPPLKLMYGVVLSIYDWRVVRTIVDHLKKGRDPFSFIFCYFSVTERQFTDKLSPLIILNVESTTTGELPCYLFIIYSTCLTRLRIQSFSIQPGHIRTGNVFPAKYTILCFVFAVCVQQRQSSEWICWTLRDDPYVILVLDTYFCDVTLSAVSMQSIGP